jgi:NAD(P)-dependent dehydrogenase (short-subunit alcohol dehydrogenase family)
MTPSSPGGNPGRGRVTALALQQVGAKVVVTGGDREHNAASPLSSANAVAC